MRICIVDDDPTASALLDDLLEDHGERVLLRDGTEAVTAHVKALDEGQPFDVFILDIIMPGMGGLEALKRIRDEENRRELPENKRACVVMLTNVRDELPRQKALGEFGADAFLFKPIDAAALKSTLDDLGFPA